MDMMVVARLLALSGVILLAAAGVLVLVAKFGGGAWPLLPGDVVYQGKHGTFVFPIVTCLLVSLVVSLLLYLARQIFK